MIDRMDLQGTNSLWTRRGAVSLDDLGGLFEKALRTHSIDLSQRLAVASESQLVLLESAVSLFRERADGLLIDGTRLSQGIKDHLTDEGYNLLMVSLEDLGDPDTCRMEWLPAGQPAPARPETVSILTSGTTGPPKILTHSWRSLMTHHPEADRPELNWLLTYLPGTYAWYQMLTLCFFCRGQHLAVSETPDPEAIWAAGTAASVTAISSTPSFWRVLVALLDREELQRLRFRQITLGGERIDQAILDRLAALFPDAQLTHIYASSEAGVVLVVQDARAGFPLEWLEDSNRSGAKLRVEDDVLYVQSPHAAQSIDGWYRTGDRVEVRGDRVVITGREEDGFLNIGGHKVTASRVEEVVMEHPGVLWCRVYAKPAPLVGAVPAADLVIDPGVLDESLVERELTAFCHRQELRDWMTPRLWNVLDEIPVGDNFKGVGTYGRTTGRQEKTC